MTIAIQDTSRQEQFANNWQCYDLNIWYIQLARWGRVTLICVSNFTVIGRRQDIIWTNDGILLIRTLWTNFKEILSEIRNIFIQEDAFENDVCEMAAILSRPWCVKNINTISPGT